MFYYSSNIQSAAFESFSDGKRRITKLAGAKSVKARLKTHLAPVASRECKHWRGFQPQFAHFGDT